MELSAATGGTFDVTVSPLIQLWQRAGRDGRWPSRVAIAEARSAVGYERIRLRPPDEVELPAHATVELGGVGKGYAVDRMVEVLRRSGAASALVNFGGSSIAALGPPAGETGWPVWIEHGGALEGPLILRDVALSTSNSLGKTGAWRATESGTSSILEPAGLSTTRRKRPCSRLPRRRRRPGAKHCSSTRRSLGERWLRGHLSRACSSRLPHELADGRFASRRAAGSPRGRDGPATPSRPTTVERRPLANPEDRRQSGLPLAE